MAEMKRELKVGKIATKEIKAVALPSKFEAKEFKDGLGRTEVLALSKIDCVIDNKTLYIPETKIKDAVAILNKNSIISNIKR